MTKFGKILTVFAGLALCVTLAACGNSGGESKVDNATPPSDGASVVSGVDQISQGVQPAGDADYSNPAVTIAADDYDGMKTFADAMLAGQHDGKVVKVTGINSRSMFGAKASVMISDGGSGKLGVTYKIKGVESIDEYPADDANIELVGVVSTDENGVRFLEVPAENLKTL